MNNLIYTDSCSESNKVQISKELGLEVITGIDPKNWELSAAAGVVMMPNIRLAVINVINEITVLEMALLHFMCKPILITAKTILNYPILNEKIVDEIEYNCDLRLENSNFIKWYKESDYI